MTGKLLLACAMAASVIVPVATETSAFAQSSDAKKKAAIAAYKKGTSAYNLGQWDKAIKYFTEAFETYPDAAFLFNLAQTHRQADSCKEASFFYGRYLAMKPDAANRAEVEGFIRDLDAECKRRAKAAAASNTGTNTNAGTATGTSTDSGTDTGTETNTGTKTDTGTGTGTDTATATGTDTGTEVAEVKTDTGTGSKVGSDAEIGDSTERKRASLIMAYGYAGPSIMSAGDVDVPVRTNITLGAGYPLHFGDITLDVGGMLSFVAVPWSAEGGMAEGIIGFSSVLLNTGASMEIFDKVTARAELGVGLMVYSGLGEAGNGFSDPNARIEGGSLKSFSTRLALGAEYAITDAIAVTVEPLVLAFSPAPHGMRSDIDNLRLFQALVGVGYKM